MTATAATPTATEQTQALELHESAAIAIEEGASSPIAADGTVLIHVIRPGVGKGRGRHVYEANMLEEHAPIFAGKPLTVGGQGFKPWKMYADHRSPEGKKAAGGLPRSLRDVAGIIKESWWDASVPADPANGFGQGAVVAKVKPVPWVRELIETDPELVETSISAQATGVRPVQRDGARAWLVEGIHPRGSVDFVTEAGAGGRVAPLLESFAEDEMALAGELLEAMDDDDFKAYIADSRPDLLEAIAADEPSTPTPPEDDVEITTAALVEALKTDEGQAALNELVEAQVESKIEDVQTRAKATVSRVVTLARLERDAHEIIEAANLPDSWKAELKGKFLLLESGEPTEGLDVFDETGEFGEVTKPARQVLRESLETVIASEQTKLREARPTVVRGQGSGGRDIEESEDGKPAPIKDASKTTWGSYLGKTAGVDPSKVYHLNGAAAE